MRLIFYLAFAGALCAQPDTRAPVTPAAPAAASLKSVSDQEIAQALQRAADFLVSTQESYEPDPPVGALPPERLPKWQEEERLRLEALRKKALKPVEWPYEGVYRVAPDGRIPAGYRVGGSSIVVEALLLIPGYAEQPARQEAVRRSLNHIAELLEKDPSLSIDAPKRGYDVRGWGHAYALEAFTLALERDAKMDAKLKKRLEALLPWLQKALAVNEIRAGRPRAGGWNYANNNQASSFMTASTLLTLHRVRALGHRVDEELEQRALAALIAARAEETGSFAYAGQGNEPMAASSARAAAGELALWLAGRSDERRLGVAVEGFFANYDELLKRKSQQGTHLPPYSIAPYYFFFGHTYAAMAIEALPEAERKAARERLLALLWSTREADGTWNDRIFPRSAAYGTAMVALALLAPTELRLAPVKATK